MNEVIDSEPVHAQQARFRLIPVLIVLFSLVIAMPGIASFFARQFFISEVINNFRLQLSVLILFSSVLLLYSGFRAGGLLQAMLGLAVVFPIASSMVPTTQPPAGPCELTLMSFNVLGNNTDQQPILDLLNTNILDVLVVVEYENAWIEPLEPLLDMYPYSVKEPRWHGFGIALYSRHPITQSMVHSITKTETDNPFVVAEIEAGGQSFVVCAGHFLAPISPARMEIRNSQMSEVANIIRNIRASKDLPVILIGDFNCVAWSPFAKDLMKATGLRDSRRGYWYHGSWPTDNPLVCIPIDNAFVSDEVHVHDRQILPALTSDHYPLVLKFSLMDSR